MFIPEYYLLFCVHPRFIFETDSGVARQKGAQSSVKSLVKLYFGLVLISPFLVLGAGQKVPHKPDKVLHNP